MYKFTDIAALYAYALQHPEQEYIPMQIGTRQVVMDPWAEQRMIAVAQQSNAALLYSHYRERLDDGTLQSHPCIAYQAGSLRDDFDFGSVVVVNTSILISE